VAALAGTSEILVSDTVLDLVLGAPVSFEERGRRALKGSSGRCSPCPDPPSPSRATPRCRCRQDSPNNHARSRIAAARIKVAMPNSAAACRSASTATLGREVIRGTGDASSHVASPQR